MSADRRTGAMTRERSIWMVALFVLLAGLVVSGLALGDPFETYHNGTALDLLGPDEG